MSEVCIAEICATPSVCIDYYYGESLFLYERRIWAWVYTYIPMVIMLYTHDPWASFGTSLIVIMIQEMTTAVSVVAGIPHVPGMIWDPGDIAFIFFFQVMGITLAMIVIMTTEAPRLVRHPYEELSRLSNEYNTELVVASDIVFEHTSREYSWLRYKYYFQIGVVQSSAISIALLYGKPLFEVKLITHLFRPDWYAMLITQGMLLGAFFYWNFKNRIEVDVIWKNSRDHYVRVYAIWFFTLAIVLLPGAFMLFPSKVGVLLGISIASFLLGILFVVSSKLRQWHQRNKKKMSV